MIASMSARPWLAARTTDCGLPPTPTQVRRRPRSVRALQKDPHYHELYSQVWTKLEEGLSQ